MARRLFVFLFLCSIFSCNKSQCERHYVKEGYIGEVTIYYDQKNGQKQFNKEGCIEYYITNSGEYYSSLKYIDGKSYSSPLFKCFELDKEGRVKDEIALFTRNWFTEDLSTDSIKYVFLTSFGTKNIDGQIPVDYFEYYIDYGYNYYKYVPTGKDQPFKEQ